MPRYSDDLINEIFSRNDIVDYVSQYVKLRKNGRDYTGLCPFHKEKSPSFHVNQEKQLFHCFGCGAGGNLVQFVMRSEGLDFLEALKLMADRAGIILPEDDAEFDDEKYQKRKRILAMNKTAARFFYEMLTKDERGKIGLKYLSERKIDARTLTKYGIGFAPDEYDALKKYMNKLGFLDDELVEASLCTVKNGKVYDKFRARVIFPIIDLRGNIIAFGGRNIKNNDNDEFKIPKYLNSSDTPVFNKGKNLFSLNFAKKESDKQCILCEGYMDVVSVYKYGIPNIVATLGTAMTEDQAKLLMKYTNEIVLCYDSDEAGQKATKRAIDIILSVGGRCRVMQLKNAKDPDEYINKNGVELFRKAMNDALPAIEYLIKQIRKKYNLETTDGKILFTEEAAEVLSRVNNAVELDAYVQKISDETSISKAAIYSEIKNGPAKDNAASGTKRIIPVIKAQKKSEAKVSDAEKKLLSIIIDSKAAYLAVKDVFAPKDYSHPMLIRLAEMIYNSYETEEPIEPAVIISKFSAEEADFVSNIFCNLETYGNEKNTVSQLVGKIKMDRIIKEIEAAQQNNDVVKIKELLDIKRKLEDEKRNG